MPSPTNNIREQVLPNILVDDDDVICDDSLPPITTIEKHSNEEDNDEGCCATKAVKQRLDWRRKINEKCKTISIPKLRNSNKKASQGLSPPPTNVSTDQMSGSESFLQLPKWGKSER